MSRAAAIRLILNHALESYEQLSVFVAPNKDTVLPASVTGPVRLNLEPRTRGNNNNMTLTDAGVDALLSFNTMPFQVHIPWSAIMAIATPLFLCEFVPVDATNAEPEKPKLILVKK